jgi:ATP-dependent DNA helicase PIF1
LSRTSCISDITHLPCFKLLCCAEQRAAFDAIRECRRAADTSRPNIFLINATAGTGKSFLCRALLSDAMAEGDITCAAASSGIAAQILPRGRTGHSAFGIPVPTEEDSTSSITAESSRGKYLQEVKLIVWDEAATHGRSVYECMDRLLIDLMQKVNTCYMAGKVVVFVADFRQCLPIVHRGTEGTKLASCITNCRFWPSVRILNLTVNERVRQRLLQLGNESAEAQRSMAYADWLLDVGEGLVPHVQVQIIFVYLSCI